MVPPFVLQSSGPGPLVTLALVAAGVGVIVVFARNSVGRLLSMLATSSSSVAEVEPGRVEVEGEVVPAGESVESSYERGVDPGDVVVAQFRKNRADGESGTGFNVPVPQQFAPSVLNGEVAVPFYVADDTGQVLVDPAHADVSIDSDYNRHYGANDETRVEGRLEAGDTVYVLGDAVPAASYEQEVTPKSGVGSAVRRFLGRVDWTTADEVIDDEDVVITRSSASSEFLVSDTSELRGQLRQGLMAGFWTLVGVLAVGSGLYLLVGGLLG